MHCVSRSKLTVVSCEAEDASDLSASNNKSPNPAANTQTTPPEPFPTASSFADAARAFVSKYPTERSDSLALGPERTNAGWEWHTKADRFRGEQGYLARRSTLWLTGGDDPAAVGSNKEAGEEGTEGDEELEELEDDDDAALHGARPGRPATRLEAEYSVVWSASYRVPMLCFRAWDESGTPASLATIAAHLLRADIPTSTEPGSRADALMLPAAPFPLIQASEHPVTGGHVWSVHPCEVRNAVEEIVVAEEREGKKDMGERGVHWLEAWFMLTDSVVDLTV